MRTSFISVRSKAEKRIIITIACTHLIVFCGASNLDVRGINRLKRVTFTFNLVCEEVSTGTQAHGLLSFLGQS